MQFPAPDLVIEVLSPATEATDRGVKFQDYALHGVAEYWIVDPEQEFIEQYRLQGEHLDLLVKARTGIIQSIVLSGFEIPVRAAFDEQEQLAALQRLLE